MHLFINMHNNTVSFLHMQHVIIGQVGSSPSMCTQWPPVCLFISYILLSPGYLHAMHKRNTQSHPLLGKMGKDGKRSEIDLYVLLQTKPWLGYCNSQFKILLSIISSMLRAQLPLDVSLNWAKAS